MTYPTTPAPVASLTEADLRSLAPIGHRQRPVKIVQLPVYRGVPRRMESLRRSAPTVTLPLRVVSLNPAASLRPCLAPAA
jgi:hypothetical protein